MEIILVANEKGGTAKSTTCLCLANCLTALGYRVLTVDTDPSGNLSAAALPDFPQNVLYDVFKGNCDIEAAIYKTSFGDILPTVKDLAPSKPKKSFIVPDRKSLSEIFDGLNGVENAEQFIRLLLRESGLEHTYDFVIIDSAPAANLLIVNAIVAADSVIIPCEPNISSVDGLNMFLASVDLAREQYNTDIQVDGLVFTRCTEKWKTRREHIEGIRTLAETKGLYLYSTKFRDSSAIETSMNECRPILDYIGIGNGATDAMNFTLEFLAKRSLAPKAEFPGIVQDESGNWIFRKNSDK